MTVYLVSREFDGLAGAGGVKDVLRGMAAALLRQGHSVRVYLPRYRFIEPGTTLFHVEVSLWGRPHDVLISRIEYEGIEVRLIDTPYFSSKYGVYTYTASDAPSENDVGRGHHDVREMNTVHQSASVLAMIREGRAPDVIHGHDGHCGLLPMFMMLHDPDGRFFRYTGLVVTIHNAGSAYQQTLGSVEEAADMTCLKPEILEGLTLGGQVNPLLAAGVYGYVNTVSPGYAKELLSGNDRFSDNLGTAYRTRGIHLKGIVNGIDSGQWLRRVNCPDIVDRETKRSMRRTIALRIGENRCPASGVTVHGSEPDPEIPWVLFHGRLTSQKGVESVLALPPTGSEDENPYQMIIYGQGESGWETAFRERASSDTRWTYFQGYDPHLTRELVCASSFLLVPSVWEPCGQIDMVGQLLGALPIVRNVGGLKKVRHRVDGFVFGSRPFGELGQVLKKAVSLEYRRQSAVSRMRRRAEKRVYVLRSWKKVIVRGYLPLYRHAASRPRHLRGRD